ncbi:hypothetical protein SI65_01646 [Aspergillus cristatus]|uniref:Enoyl reductase (ER) domain-containing protein n=1 Tax=Aspergillus cristatus TaxID=573508 RepID=A0A1E3BUN1_ASPCR|nr:hypothetical protein SI65_01646 [Aspergillus cristatus]
MTHPALYVDETLTFKVIHTQQPPTPEDGELLIETHFSGANPADIKHATVLGIYPTVLGYDFCGKVVQTASDNSAFQPGDIVAGYTPTGIGRKAKYGAHQRHMVCPEDLAFKVPSNLPKHHAATLSVVVMTAADALYNFFGFPLPSLDEDEGKGKVASPLLIWGASSSVGLAAVQFARASGVYPIYVTASAERHPLLLELGATQCFNYKSPTVVEDIKTALRESQQELKHAFDTVGSNNSAKLMADCTSPSNDTILISVVFQDDPRFKMPFAAPGQDVTIELPGTPGRITIPARPEDYQHARNAFLWAIENYGVKFEMPMVKVFEESAEALKQLRALAGLGSGFGKIVLRHPLR